MKKQKTLPVVMTSGLENTRVITAYEILRAPQHIKNLMDSQVFDYILMERTRSEKKSSNPLSVTIDPVQLAKFYDNGSTRRLREFKECLKGIYKKTATTVSIRSDRLEKWKDASLGYELREKIQDDCDLIVEGLIITDIAYPSDESLFTLHFNPNLLPALKYVQDYYSSYNLCRIQALNTKYGPLFYRMLQTWIGNKSEPGARELIWQISSDSAKMPGLRQFMNIENKYKDPYDLERRVIKAGIDDINEHTDLWVQYDWMENRTAIRLKFQYKASVRYETHQTDTIFLTWLVIELINALLGKHYFYGATENISVIKKLVKKQYSPKQIISAPLKQIHLFGLKADRLRPKYLFNSKENGNFDSLCQENLPSLLDVMLEWGFEDDIMFTEESKFKREIKAETLCLAGTLLDQDMTPEDSPLILSAQDKAEIEIIMGRKMSPVDEDQLRHLMAQYGYTSVMNAIDYLTIHFVLLNILMLLAFFSVIKRHHLEEALAGRMSEFQNALTLVYLNDDTDKYEWCAEYDVKYREAFSR